MQNMRNKYVLYAFLALLVIVISIIVITNVSAADNDESWKIWRVDMKNSFLESIPVVASLSDRNTVLMNFYPVEDWEVEVCTRDVSSMTDRSETNYGQEYSLLYNGMAIAVAGTKYKYTYVNDTIYNIEWYVMPEDKDITYSVYLNTSAGQVFYISQNAEAKVRTGSGASFSNTYAIDYKYVGVIYTIKNEHNVKITKYIESEIVIDNEASYG
ncbi:MAG: hypothetical protein ACP5OA_01880 [Candidatus Woesearchaeota archaeon]